jgi:hypothetical protein
LIVQIRKLVQNSPKVSGNGAKGKQLAERADADKHTLYMFLDGQALFTGLFHMYATTYKELRGILQRSSEESREEDAAQAEQKINVERETKSVKTSTVRGNRRDHLQLAKTHGRWQLMTSFRRSGIYL